MADRIAVMKDGEMVQIASPLEMYERPQTKFVAEFIGSPAMNLLPARINAKGRMDCDLKVLGVILPDAELTANPVAPAETAAYIGIRPEHLALVEALAGDFDATVDLVEPLGQTTNVYLNVGDIRLVAVVDRTSARAGQRVGVKVRREALRLVAA